MRATVWLNAPSDAFSCRLASPGALCTRLVTNCLGNQLHWIWATPVVMSAGFACLHSHQWVATAGTTNEEDSKLGYTPDRACAVLVREKKKKTVAQQKTK